MPAYIFASVEIADPAAYEEYRRRVPAIIAAYGGRYLARSTRIEKLEGEREPPQVLLVIEWPSKEHADAFYESEEYAPYRESRRAGARNQFFLVAGEDVNGLARMDG